MNPFEMLKRDHREVESLFESILESEDEGEQEEQRHELIQALLVHAQIEEREVYPTARKAVPSTEDAVLEALEEHHMVRVAVAELAGCEPSDERFRAKVEVLQELVDHHVEEEEDELFPTLESQLDEAALDDLAERLKVAKQEEQARPQRPEMGGAERTRDELYEEAKRQDIPGRSSMTKAELKRKVRGAR